MKVRLEPVVLQLQFAIWLSMAQRKLWLFGWL